MSKLVGGEGVPLRSPLSMSCLKSVIFLGLFSADGEQYNEVRRFTIRFLGQVATEKLESVTHKEMMKFFSTLKSGEIRKVTIRGNVHNVLIIGGTIQVQSYMK